MRGPGGILKNRDYKFCDRWGARKRYLLSAKREKSSTRVAQTGPSAKRLNSLGFIAENTVVFGSQVNTRGRLDSGKSCGGVLPVVFGLTTFLLCFSKTAPAPLVAKLELRIFADSPLGPELV
jgi:hypothetical protein